MKVFKRITIALVFSLLVSIGTFFIARGKQEKTGPALQQSQNLCIGCHQQVNDAVVAGSHGHASSDPVFNQMWSDQGKPGACLVCHVTGYDPASGTWEQDGVSCTACHGQVSPEHLKNPSTNPVPVDRTSDLCGRCHTGERFNIVEWQASTHFQRAMTCTVCHDSHAATLKTVQGQEDAGPSALCINCHSEVSMAFPYSKHHQSGVSCVDCHLRHFTPGDDNQIHALPDHSFTASISTCSTCHADQMHAEAASTSPGVTTPTVSASVSPTPVEETAKPSPVSPYGFAGLAGLIGLAGGMVLQPWLERAYRKMNKKDEKK